MRVAASATFDPAVLAKVAVLKEKKGS